MLGKVDHQSLGHSLLIKDFTRNEIQTVISLGNYIYRLHPKDDGRQYFFSLFSGGGGAQANRGSTPIQLGLDGGTLPLGDRAAEPLTFTHDFFLVCIKNGSQPHTARNSMVKHIIISGRNSLHVSDQLTSVVAFLAN